MGRSEPRPLPPAPSSEGPPLRHRSLTDLNEGEFIERLTAGPSWRSPFLGIKGIPSDALPSRALRFTGLPGSPLGDVDLLLSSPGRPETSIALEAKKVKVSRAGLRSGQPNNRNGLVKGIRQANLLERIGFSQVYLWVFVAVDSREQNGGRITFEGLSPDLAGKIRGWIEPLVANLHPRAGLVQLELVQPMDYAPLGQGTTHLHLIRLATPAPQPSAVTAWVNAQSFATFDPA